MTTRTTSRSCSETFIQFYKTAASGIYFAMLAVSCVASSSFGGIVIMNIMFVSVSEPRGASAWPRSPAPHPPPVPDRIRGHLRTGRISSASSSGSSSPGSSPRRRPCPRRRACLGRSGHGHVLVDRPVLRHLSGQPGGQAQSGRGPAGGAMRSRSSAKSSGWPSIRSGPQAPVVPDHPGHRHRHRHGLDHPGT